MTPCPRCGGAVDRWREVTPEGESEPHALCTTPSCPFEY